MRKPCCNQWWPRPVSRTARPSRCLVGSSTKRQRTACARAERRRCLLASPASGRRALSTRRTIWWTPTTASTQRWGPLSARMAGPPALCHLWAAPLVEWLAGAAWSWCGSCPPCPLAVLRLCGDAARGAQRRAHASGGRAASPWLVFHAPQSHGWPLGFAGRRSCTPPDSLALQARLEPVDMASFEPPTARRFALRQLALMQSRRLSQRKAYEIVSSPPWLAWRATASLRPPVLSRCSFPRRGRAARSRMDTRPLPLLMLAKCSQRHHGTPACCSRAARPQVRPLSPATGGGGV